MTEQRLRATEVENSVLNAQIDRMYKELDRKDEEIRKLNMQLDERKILLGRVLARITLNA